MLAPVRVPENPSVLVGSATADDAGVVQIRDDLALVQTVDFFPPMVDDAFAFGRVGASNSISDVYAMGGTPVSAVCVYALPPGLPEFVPPTILEGAISVCSEAGIPLVGGHTVKDSEIKFGLCVTGTIHPGAIVSNAGAKPGDVLVLTKPLGSGFLCTAIKRDVLDETTTARVIETMASLNRGAAEAMVEVGVHAATDITGFGLLGHSVEMAKGAGVSIDLVAADAPWIEGLEPHITPENTCGGLKRNRAYAEGKVAFDGGSDAQVAVLSDPQTSGGLLISVAEAKLDALLARLEQSGVTTRAVVGRVTEKAAHDVRVL